MRQTVQFVGAVLKAAANAGLHLAVATVGTLRQGPAAGDPDLSPEALSKALVAAGSSLLDELDKPPAEFDMWAVTVAQDKLRLAMRAVRGERLSSVELGRLHGVLAWPKGEVARAVS